MTVEACQIYAEDLIRYERFERGESADKAEEEVVCDTMGKVLHSRKAMRELARSLDATVAGKVYRLLRDVADKVKGALGKEQDYSTIDMALRDFLDAVKQRAKKGPVAPIKAEKSGTIAEFLERNKDYKKDLNGPNSYIRNGRHESTDAVEPTAEIGGTAETSFSLKRERKAPNGKESNLDEKQYKEVRTPQFKKWAGDWELAAKNRLVSNLKPQPLERKEYTEEEIEDIYGSLSQGVNKYDGRIVDFVHSTLGKILRHKGFDYRLIVPKLKDIFDDSVPVLSEKEQTKEGHKIHGNFEGYHHYLGKVSLDGNDFYVRLTVQELHTNPSKKKPVGFTPNQLHSAHISDVEIYNADQHPVDSQIINRATDDVTSTKYDAKLHDFLKSAKDAEENSTKVVDENGEPLVVYHGTDGNFNTFRRTNDIGFHFGDRRTARTRIGRGGNLMPVYLDIKNPIRINQDFGSWDAEYMLGKYLVEKGYITKEELNNVLYSEKGYKLADAVQNKNLRELLLSKGYDGIIYTNWYESDSKPSYIAFKPTQVKSATENNGEFSRENPDIRYSLKRERRDEDGARRNVPTFYSNAERAVEGVKQGKATAEQWKAMLTKAGGIKSGEDKWMGLSQWLDEHKGQSLTKAEVLQFVRDNGIQMEEVNYQEGVTDPRIPERVYDGFEEYYNRWTDDDFDTPLDHLEHAWDVYCNVNPRWIKDSIEPHLYRDGTWDLRIKDRQILKDNTGIHGDYSISKTRLSYTTEGLDNRREIAFVVPDVEPYQEGDEIHFGPENQGRAVMWVRFGEANDTDGNRVLVIDEIQSNRHQEGREKGYDLMPKDRVRYESLAVQRKQAMESYYARAREVALNGGNFATAWAEDNRAGELFDAWGKIDKEIKRLTSGDIPAAPFEKNWHEVAMKRMLRLAAEEGFDKVAWTTGEQQAQRYDISRRVDSIIYKKNDDGTYSVSALTGGRGNMLGGSIPESNLAEIVGRDLTNKILNNEGEKTETSSRDIGTGALVTEYWNALSGDNLRLGGEGMKGFYDQMLPRFMDKYGKRWGVKTGEVQLVTPGQEVMHSVDVTPEMRRSVLEQGQPLFSLKRETRTDADGNEVYTETREDGTKDREITTYGDGSKKALWYDDKGHLKERLDYFPYGAVRLGQDRRRLGNAQINLAFRSACTIFVVLIIKL